WMSASTHATIPISFTHVPTTGISVSRGMEFPSSSFSRVSLRTTIAQRMKPTRSITIDSQGLHDLSSPRRGRWRIRIRRPPYPAAAFTDQPDRPTTVASVRDRIQALNEDIAGEVIRLRRTIHSNPELAYEEHETARLVTAT